MSEGDATLDIEELLQPIRADNPAGESMRYEPVFDEIQEARRADDSTNRGDYTRGDPKKSDWPAVVRLGTSILSDQSKDFQVAAWVTEALASLEGLSGLRDGLRLLRALQDTYWETMHPDPGDKDLKESIYEFLDNPTRLPLIVRGVPITDPKAIAGYSFRKYKESREVESEIRKSKDPDERSQTLESLGMLRAKAFDDAVLGTGRAFYENLLAELAECRSVVEELSAANRAPERFGPNGPGLSETLGALKEVTTFATQLLARKPAPAAPQPEPEPESEPEPEPEPESEPEPEPTVAAPVAVARRPVRPSGDPRGQIAAAAARLRESDPADPTSYLVIRALAMGGLYRAADPPDPALLPAPSTEERQSLRRLASEGSWQSLLEDAERSLAEPSGRGWIDVRRYALAALEGLERPVAARAARALLAAEVRDYPGWPAAELDDGTPCANGETRSWLRDNFAPSAPAAPQPVEFPTYTPPPSVVAPRSEGGAEAAAPDPWDEARAFVSAGQNAAAVAAIARAVRESRTGRERFLRTLQQAELCLLLSRPQAAAPLLETLQKQIDDFRLDQWEDPAVCARVFAALYRCLRGHDPARAQEVYRRLCQLDIGQALGLGDESPP
jgi:type VI secretion system protein ImpA